MHPISTDKGLIRVGPEGDGGYLLPDDLEGIEALVSPGVGNKQGFDLYFANLGIKVFMADASVDGPIESHPNFFFMKKFLGVFDNHKYISMEAWYNKMNVKTGSDLLLQMDIEGSEYEVLYNIPHHILKQFRIIVIEFHDLDMLWNRQFFNRFKNVFLRLLHSYYVVHNHPNNCCPSFKRGKIEIPPVLEITLYRKDRANKVGYINNFPHNLDVDCTDKRPLCLPEFWYRKD